MAAYLRELLSMIGKMATAVACAAGPAMRPLTRLSLSRPVESCKEEAATSDVASMLVQTRTVAAPISIDADFAELIETVWACERWERVHPFTVATIRALASGRGHSESDWDRQPPGVAESQMTNVIER